jgi:hypothetical protein
MTSPTDCTPIIDAHILIREGTSQGQRQLEALKPGYVQVDEHQPADWMVFAQGLSFIEDISDYQS